MNLAKYQGLQYQASMGLVAPRCMNKQTQVAGFSRHVHGWIVQIVGAKCFSSVGFHFYICSRQVALGLLSMA